jgi:site-specific recombinase XerD
MALSGDPDVSSRSAGHYWCARRPSNAAHGFQRVVFDTQDRIHVPLTIAVQRLERALSANSLRAYLPTIFGFFTFLETDRWQVMAYRRWNDAPDQVRRAIEDYLFQYFGCQVGLEHNGHVLVSLTATSPQTVKLFLSALKTFYRAASQEGLYTHPNPLVDAPAAGSIETQRWRDAEQAEGFPRMPSVSGLALPRPQQRLTDSYYVLQGNEWKPYIVDDPGLYRRVLDAGARFHGWGEREDCVVRLLFESGARISEVTGLSLGGWQMLGGMTQARVINKGSRGRPVKTLVFRKDTAKRLQRYFDGERRAHDPRGWGLQEHVSAFRSKRLDLWNVSIFLTEQSTPNTAKNFRDHYWSPACRAAGLNLDVHQARHWYVTMRISWIYETGKTAKEIDDEKTKLKEYMAWARGDAMLDVYDAHVKEARRMEDLTEFHAYLDSVLKKPMRAQRATLVRRYPVDRSCTPGEDDLESEQLAYLESMLR